MLIKFSTLAGGVFIEVSGDAEYKASDRCFRFDQAGRAEYALYGDLTSVNPAPRWFSHVYTAKSLAAVLVNRHDEGRF